MSLFLELLMVGTVNGALYALISLAFVVVYKASSVMNFALGEFVLVGGALVAMGLNLFGLGLAGSLVLGTVGMILLSGGFNHLVLHRIVGTRLISLIMVTIGLGAFLRGCSGLAFGGFSHRVSLPLPIGHIYMGEVVISPAEMIAGSIAVACVAAVAGYFALSHTGLVLRAIADDQQAAMSTGIKLRTYFTFTWALAGTIAMVGGTLWTFLTGGGFGMALVGLKVFPIVIIGGLDSIVGVMVGGVLVGLLESLAAGYVDPLVGGGFSNVAAYIVLIAVLMVRPYGIFGREAIERV